MHSDNLFHKEKLSFSKPLELRQAQFIALSKLKDSIVSSKLMWISLIVSYSQVCFQTTQLATDYFPGYQQASSSILETIQNVFLVENVFTYNRTNGPLFIVCCCVILYFILLIISLFRAVYQQTLKPNQTSFLATKVWPFLIRIHGPVLFFPINNICLRLQAESWNDNLQLFSEKTTNEVIFYPAVLVCLVNILFASLPYILLFDVLPGKNPLASKNFLLDQVNLYQKLFFSLSGKFLPNTPVMVWLTLCSNTFLSIIRLFWWQYSLPRYNFTSLSLELYLINICGLASVVELIVFGLNQILDYPITMASFTLVLFFLTPFPLIFSHILFNKTITQVIFEPFEELNSHKALHKVLALKFLEKSMRNPGRYTKRFDIRYFYFSALQCNPRNLYGKKSEIFMGLTIDLKEKGDGFKRKYLEHLVSCHNKSDEFKLILARFYARSLKLYVLAIKTLARINSNSFSIRASAKILQLEIQEQIIRHYKTNDEGLNLCEYFIVAIQKEDLKQQIRRQLDYHHQFWKEFSKSGPDVWELQRLSEAIHGIKQKIAKQWVQLENSSSKNISYFCSLYGCYQYLLNDTPTKGREYMKKYDNFNQRHIQKAHLASSNLCDKDNISITIRTHQDCIGVISDCSSSVKRGLGYERDEIIGTNFSSMLSPCVAERHNSFIQEYIKTGQTIFIGRLQTVFVKDRVGSLQKVSLWVNIHPVISQEIRLTGLFRVIQENKEYILLTPQGEIDSYTTRIASKLGIKGRRVHINQVCRNFRQVDELYDIQQTELKHNDNRKEKSLEFNYYSNIIQLSSKIYSYQCEIRTIPLKQNVMTAIEFIEGKSKEGNYSNNPNRKIKRSDMKDKKIQLNSEIPEDYNTGVNELQSTDKNLLTNRKDSVNHTKKDETMLILANQDLNTVETPNLTVNSPTNLQTKMPLIDDTPTAKLIPKQATRPKVKVSLSRGSSVSTKDKKPIFLEDVFEVKYYPRTLVSFLTVLCVIFLGTLALQLYLQIEINRDLAYSKALSTTLNLATSRADAFTQIGRACRAAHYVQAGFVPQDSVAAKNTLAAFVSFLEVSIPILKDTNAKLLVAIQDVDKVFQDKFKSANVRVYDINANLTKGTYRMFDTFTGINIIIEKVLKVQKYYIKTSSFILQDLYYALVNCVNDLLEGNVHAITLMLDTTNLSFQNIKNILRTCQIVFMSLLGAEALIALWFGFHIYQMELDLTQKMLGINVKNVEFIRSRLDYFEKVLQNESFDQPEQVELTVSFAKEINTYDRQKVKTEQNFKNKGLQKFYLKKIVILLSMLLCYTIGVYFMLDEVDSRVGTLKQKINGLTKTQIFLYEASIMAFTLAQVLCGEIVSPVRNRLPEVELTTDFNSFLDRGNDLLNTFTQKDGSYDPLVAPFFFEDACKFISSSSTAKGQCMAIVKDSKGFGLLSIFNRHYGMIRDIYLDFQASNREFATLSNFIVRSVTLIVPSTAVIREVVLIMIGRIQDNLKGLWSSTSVDVNYFLTICPLLLSLIGLVTWIYLLKHLAECFNRFKRMMRVVPFDILMSYPILKGVLVTSSKGKLKRIKNDI